MIRKVVFKLIKYLIKKFDLPYYKIEELQIGGHCGCCGAWVPNEIFPADWSWGLCRKCVGGGEKNGDC